MRKDIKSILGQAYYGPTDWKMANMRGRLIIPQYSDPNIRVSVSVVVKVAVV